MAKYYFFSLFMTFMISLTYAQNHTLSGTVTTSDGKPVEFASIAIKGTSKGSVTDKNGNFEIRNVQPRVYTLSASFVGSLKQELVVDVNAGGIAQINFILHESALELASITIEEGRLNKFYSDSAFIISKLPLKDLENPQVYNSVSRKLLQEQVVTNFNDAIKNATGITRLWESTGRGGDGAEYFSMRGFAVQPTLVNGMPSVNNGGFNPANVETIEVIKGPSGTLFGSPMIAYGGLINITTKRPYDFFGGRDLTY